MGQSLMIKKGCPFCGASTELEVDKEEYAAYVHDRNLILHFGKRPDYERELIRTGMCYSCQERTFGRPMPGNENAWGNCLGECDCCGTPIYDKASAAADGKYVCKSCCLVHRYEGNELIPEYEE